MLTQAALSEVHSAKTIARFEPAHKQTACFYFTLEGVTTADPLAPGSEWFAMERDANGAKEILATLLAARVSGTPVTVYTSGELRCGYAEVLTVFL
jgi:hypothetical protein